MKISDKQIVKIFVISVLLMIVLGMIFCFVSCKYAPPIIAAIINLLKIIVFLCLLYFLYRLINWLIRFGKRSTGK